MDTTSYCSSAVNELAANLIQVQRVLQPVTKDKENPFAKSRYATLKAVVCACRDILLEKGIWVTQYPVPAEVGHLGLVTKLTHAESGQWQSSLLVMPLPKADPQGYGSAMTYARRYALSALLGMVTEDDDDAEGAVPPPDQARRAPKAEKPGLTPPEQEPHSADPVLASLPRLDGILYEMMPAKDGRQCIVAKGNTTGKRTMLTAAGFSWNAHRKIWWRYAA